MLLGIKCSTGTLLDFFLWLSGKTDDTCSEKFPGQAYVRQALPNHAQLLGR